MNNKYGDVKSFTIKRSVWARANKEGHLLSQIGKKCCLGFYATACGLRDEDIFEIPLPSELNDIWSTSLSEEDIVNDTFDYIRDKCIEIHSGTLSYLNSLEDLLSNINDSDREGLETDQIKEDYITRLFKSIDIDVTFVD